MALPILIEYVLLFIIGTYVLAGMIDRPRLLWGAAAMILAGWAGLLFAICVRLLVTYLSIPTPSTPSYIRDQNGNPVNPGA